jgi:hypothetical protein|nr:MAG TPA: hypothetical protein [Caudoviricetes sp.]
MNIDLVPLTMEHKKIVEEIRNRYDLDTNTGSFNACYLWKDFLDIHIFATDNMYVIKEGTNPIDVWAFPMGENESKKQFIKALLSYSQPTFLKVRSNDKIFLEKEFPNVFDFKLCEDTCEYIYSGDEFAKLQGKKFRKFREAVNNIARNHTLKTEIINSSNMDAVKTVFQKWSFHRGKSGMDNTVGNETDKILLDNFDTLGLFGIITFIDAVPASVAIGYNLSADTCDISTFKHTGIVKDLCRITLREFMMTFGNRLKFFNFEEDGGIEGLRIMKHRLNPCKVNKLWKATVRRE